MPVVQERSKVLLEILHQTGPDKPFHVEDLMLRLIMDTTGVSLNCTRVHHNCPPRLGSLCAGDDLCWVLSPGHICEHARLLSRGSC